MTDTERRHAGILTDQELHWVEDYLSGNVDACRPSADVLLSCMAAEVRRLRTENSRLLGMLDYARRMADSYQRRIAKAEGMGLIACEQRAVWVALRNVLDCAEQPIPSNHANTERGDH